MAVAAKESLQQRTTSLNSAVEDANYAVSNDKNLRNLEKRRTELEAAWLSYQQAFEYHQLKVTDEEARAAAQQARRLQRNSSDEALEELEELIEVKQAETGKMESEEADNVAGRLANAQVKGVNEEVERRLGILKKRLEGSLNNSQIRVVRDEICNLRTDLSQKLNATFSSLIAHQKTADRKLEANEKRDLDLKQLNENLDNALGTLLSKVTEPKDSAMPSTEVLASVVTSAVGAIRLGGASSEPRYQAYAKEAFPKFEGEIRKYPAWKKEMKELVLPGLSAVKQIRILDKQTPEAVDLTNCTTVEEAWVELDAKYGNSVNISTTLMEEFLGYKLNSVSDESKVVEVKTVVMKLNTNLRAVGFEDHLQASPFILNKIVEMLPRFWQNDFSKQKATMLAAATEAEAGRPQWTIISEYLKSEALRIETDMPWSLDASDQEAKWPKIAKVNSNQARVVNTSLSKDVKCPECNMIHQYYSYGSRRTENSDRFSSCPKFRAGNSTEKAELLAKYGACARCTAFGHEKASCKITSKCEEGGCTQFHHPSVHGTSIAYVNSLKVVNKLEGGQPEKFLHILNHRIQGVNYLVFLDDGSDCTLISAKAAKRLGLKGFVQTCYMLRCGDKKPSVAKRKMYKLDIVANDGQKITLTLMEVVQITSKQKVRDVTEAYKLFPHVPSHALDVAEGEVDIMIGQDYAALLATGGEGLNIVGNLRAMRCRLGSGWVLGGWHPLIKGEGVSIAAKANLLRVQKRVYNSARVNNLQCVRDCGTVIADDIKDLSCQLPRVRQGSKELQMINDNIRLGKEQEVCKASYPVMKDTSASCNNQWQAEKMAMTLEKQLAEKPGGQEEDDGGKVGFVSHHALEPPDQATTKLRMMSNSLLKNTGIGPSPNSVWKKGHFGGGLQLLLVWAVVLACLSVGAVHVEVASSYGTDSFFVAFKSFVSRRGQPARENPVNWNWSKMEGLEGRMGTVFRFCLNATAWRNRMAGQRFSGLEKGLDMLVISSGKSLNFTEFVALVRGIANLFNDRPLLLFGKWKNSMGNLKVGDIVFFGHKQRLGKGEYKLARVKETFPDESGLVRSGAPSLSSGLEVGQGTCLIPQRIWRKRKCRFKGWC